MSLHITRELAYIAQTDEAVQAGYELVKETPYDVRTERSIELTKQTFHFTSLTERPITLAPR
jgi:hypothetical protein